MGNCKGASFEITNFYFGFAVPFYSDWVKRSGKRAKIRGEKRRKNDRDDRRNKGKYKSGLPSCVYRAKHTRLLTPPYFLLKILNCGMRTCENTRSRTMSRRKQNKYQRGPKKKKRKNA
ncbi:hypothetical protein POVCU2_0005360 [Plasmodium ovale curtisi]|uniref:Uncharacterized protein n=1 Tax=Plasmodium ovale curtisi TaxID=864141 RepID=A0A1A8VMC9_PLAOA|nr:hypothetical protein POVCU2_0005360 [Plasmodium ovale curtisi]